MSLLLAVIAGGLVGSFLNVCIDRLPRGESVVAPPSHCDACGRRLSPLELAPVVSYLWLRGRCRYCGVRLSPRLPVVEALTAALFGFVAASYGWSAATLFALVFGCLFILFFFIDLERSIVPNRLVFPGMALALLLSPLWPGLGPLSAVGGGLLAFAVLFVVYVAARGGMGLGDVKLAALVGLVNGPMGSVVALAVAVVSGGVVAGLLLASGRKGRKDAIPFGPFLSVGAVVALFWGEPLRDWYLRLVMGGV